MDVFLVFNELSAKDLDLKDPQARHHAPKRMEQLVAVINTARKMGINALRRGEDFFDIALAEGYTIRDWVQDHQTDRDQRRRLQSAALAYDDLFEVESTVATKSLGYEFSLDGRPAVGLGYAYLLESVAVSLDGDQPHWRTSEICIDCAELDESADDIFEREEVIHHALEMAHLSGHLRWVDERHVAGVTNGADLLTKIADWYPSLVFVDAVKAQIKEMTAGTPQLRQAVAKLFDLEHYCQQWTTGPFDKNALRSKATPESATVAADSSLRALREFRLPDGRPAYFEWHVRLTPHAWRMHFLPDAVSHCIYVGYIGPHLATGRF